MNTEISRYLVDANGDSFSSDTDLQRLSNNAKVKNTNSGVSYKKVQGTTPGVLVFDKVPFQEGHPDAVLYNSEQSLTSAQKRQARVNIAASGPDAVLYSQQTLTSSQKEQARNNIGALATSDLPVGSKTKKGILQVGSGINVSSGVISVDNDYIIGLVGGAKPEIKDAIYSEVSVFGTRTSDQESHVGQLYAGSKLYRTTSNTGESYSEDYALVLSDPLSGTWKCISSSSVTCNKQTSQTSGTSYSFEVRRGSFIKV